MLRKTDEIGTNVLRALPWSQDAPSQNRQISKFMQLLQKQAYQA